MTDHRTRHHATGHGSEAAAWQGASAAGEATSPADGAATALPGGTVPDARSLAAPALGPALQPEPMDGGGVSIVSTSVNHEITPNQGGYANYITVTSTGAISGQNNSFGGVDMNASASLINYGTISGYTYGVNTEGTQLSQDAIYNHGSIHGHNVGVRLLDTVLTNAIGGTISSSNGLGASISVRDGGDSLLTNAGSIFGTTGLALYGGTLVNRGNISGVTGVTMSGGVLIDTGIINASGTTAIIVDGGTLQVTEGAAFSGAITGNDEGRLQFDDGGSFSLNPFSSAFNTLTLLAGGQQIIVSGTSAAFAAFAGSSGQAGISGFSGTDQLVVDGFVATQSVYLQGEGIELVSGGQTLTLGISGIFGGEALGATTGGGNTTILLQSQVSTISSALTNSVAAGQGHYAAALTIAGAGSIIPAAAGATALSLAASGDSVLNEGSLAGGAGEGGGEGGTGVLLDAGTLTNTGSIAGGAGQGAGAGGIGVSLSAGALANQGTISGGNGGTPSSGQGGNGGAGILLQGGTLSNSGLIESGRFGTGPQGNGAAAAAVTLSGGVLVNTGTINGYRLSDAVQFAGDATLEFGQAAIFGGAIGDFAAGDTLVALGTVFTHAGYYASSLDLTGAGGEVELDLTGNFTGEFIALATAGGNTTITLEALIATITSSLATELTPGTGSFASAVSITSTGDVQPAATGGTAVYIGQSGESVRNSGQIVGGTGAAGAAGGIGVQLGNGSLSNQTLILGGTGGASPSSSGGKGGTGVSMLLGTATNGGTVTGGTGGASATDGGAGGTGVSLSGGTFLNNGHGRILGGAGGHGTLASGAGGAGAYLDAGTLINDGTIIGQGGAAAVQFAGPATLEFGTSAVFTGAINGFSDDDKLIAEGAVFTAATYVLGVGLELEGAGTVVLDLTGNFVGDSFSVTNDGTNSTIAVDIVVSTITSQLTTSVTPGEGRYTRALTVANNGAVTPNGYGTTAVYGTVDGNRLYNIGTLKGADGRASNNGSYIAAGSGALFTTGTLLNHGTLTGGQGGNANDAQAGTGGAGLVLQGGTAANLGTIAGGTGGQVFGSQVGAGGSGVLLEAGTLTNSLLIKGGQGGKSYGSTAGGQGGDGASLSGGALTNDASIIGGQGGDGVSSGRGGGGGSGVSLSGGTLTNSGTITGGTGYTSSHSQGAGGVGVYLDGGTLIDSGVLAGGAGSGPAADAVLFGSLGGTLVIDPQATFSGAIGGFAAGADTLVIAGTVFTGATYVAGTGLELFGAITPLTLDVTGPLLANDIFVLADDGQNTTLTALVSTISTAVSQGVTLGAGRYAPTLTVTGTGTVIPAADGTTGVTVGAADSLLNQGTIAGGVGQSDAGIDDFNGYQGGIGVAQSGGTLTNDGAIAGGGGGGGEVAGAGAAGVSLSGGALANYGTITGGAGGNGTFLGGNGGVGVALSGATLTNAGAIEGGAGGSGNLSGDSGDAVQFGDVAATLIVDPSGVFEGQVAANAAVDDVLVLAGSSAASLAGLGTAFTGFSTLDFAGGSTWTVDSTLAALDGGQAIAGFALGDAIVLDGFAETTETSVAGTGIELSDGGSTYTIALAGNYGNRSFNVTTDGTNTTIEVLVATIANAVTSPVTLGAAFYASTLTIADIGSVIPSAYGATAVTLGAADSLLNQGTIAGGVGQSDGGIGGFAGYSGGTGLLQSGGTVTNSGAITGGNGGDGISAGNGGAGVSLSGGTLINYGAITGGSGGASQFAGGGGHAGDAVQFGGVAATLIVDPGAVFNGQVAANAAVNDVLVLAGSSAATLAGLGTQFTGFSTLDFAAGSTWTVDSALAALDGGQTITGFALGDTIVLDGFAETTETTVAGTGIELSDGGSTYTIALAGNYGNRSFNVTTDGTNTTIEVLVATIANAVTSPVTLGAGFYASTLTITDTGSVIPAADGTTGVTVGAADSLLNQGTIAGGVGQSDAGIDDFNGYPGGIGVAQSGGTLTNDGAIAGGGGGGGEMAGAGAAGVSLSGGWLTNNGTITGGVGGNGTFLGGNGGVGVALSGATLTNAGVIEGGAGGSGNLSGDSGDAVQFGDVAATLILDPGAVFDGQVAANSSVNDVLELAGLRFGTLSGLGSAYTGFTSLVVDRGSQWFLRGTDSFAGTVTVAGNLDPESRLTITGSLTVESSGFLISVDDVQGAATVLAGVYVDGGLVTNLSTIAGALGINAVTGTAGAGGAGVVLDGGTLTNGAGVSTFINGGDGGVAVRGTASGGDAGAGVLLLAGTLINSSASFIRGGLGGLGQAFGGSGGAGVYIDGGTLITAGTIQGGGYGRGGNAQENGQSGDAVQFGSVAAATLVIDPGAAFTGSVAANTAVDDVLVLAGSSAATLAGLGTQFTGFSTLDFAAGSTWTVDSTLAALDGGQAIAGFALGDAIVLDGFAETTETTVAGTGIELGYGGSTYTIALAGNYGNRSFNVTTDGTNTTITLDPLIRTISNAVTASVTLGNATYAPTLTVTGTGSVIPAVYGATGITLSAGDSLLNQGAVAGGAGVGTNNGHDGSFSSRSAGAGATGVSLGDATLTNTGTITGGAGGNGGQYYVYAGSGGAGVTASAGDVINDGSIKGGTAGRGGNDPGNGGAGVALTGGTLTNTGAITGGQAYFGQSNLGHGGAGVFLAGGTLISGGTITGGNDYTGGGDAVQFGSLAATLIVDPGAVFNGQVAADTAVNDALVLAGSAAATLTGLGSQFTGFSTLDFAAGSTWTVDSTLAALDAGQTIAGFALGDTIVLEGFAATTETAIAGTGLELGFGGSTYTIALAGNYGGHGFDVSTDGTNTTIALDPLISTISTAVTAGVTLGNATYAPTLTITGTGSVIPAAYAAAAVTLGTAGDDLLNEGVITGATGSTADFGNDAGSGGGGVSLYGGTLTNDGTITGGKGGPAAGIGQGGNGGSGVLGSFTLTNDSTIMGGAGGGSSGDRAGSGGSGVSLTAGMLINTGTIGGGGGGSSAQHAGAGGAGVAIADGDLTNHNVIYGGVGGTGSNDGNGGTGVTLNTGTLVNTGTIAGGAGGSGGMFDGDGGAGVAIGSGVLTNSNAIYGGAGSTASYGGDGGAGISVDGGSATNSGRIHGGAGGGTFHPAGGGGTGAAVEAGYLGNTGTITGGNGGFTGNGSAGAGGSGATLQAGTLVNSGTIAAGAGGSGATGNDPGHGGNGGAGVALYGGTLINAGRIAGGAGGNGGLSNGQAGDAVQFGNVSATLVIDPGASFGGNVVAHYGDADALVLAGSSAATLSGLGTQFTGFSTLDFAAGSTWTVESTLAAVDAGETITGFTARDALILDGFVETSATYVSGTGLTLIGGATVTIDLGLSPGLAYAVSTDGTNTEIQALVGTISTGVTTGVTLGAGLYAPTLTVTGTGSVIPAAYGANGVTLGAADSLLNHGTIAGGVGQSDAGFSGFFGYPGGSGVVQSGGTVSNYGVITGGKGGNGSLEGAAGGVGVSLNGGTLINDGTINGGENGRYPDQISYAVQFGSGAATLIVDPGAVFNGQVAANAAVDDVLVLAGSSAATLAGFGTGFTGFTGFSSLDFAAGSTWTVDSTLAALDAGQTIAGFALGDAIVLEGFAATTETAVAGTGLELGFGGSTYTIALAGNYGGHGFDVSTDGTNTTIALDPLISTISTAVTASVTLGNATYASTLTITGSGSVEPAAYAAAAVTLGNGASLTNSGSIINSNQIHFVNGVAIQAGSGGSATLLNTSHGTITTSAGSAVYQTSGALALTNYGTIGGSECTGIALYDPSSGVTNTILNQAGGVIEGGFGIECSVLGETLDVTNYGFIYGRNLAVKATSLRLANYGTISGSVGVYGTASLTIGAAAVFTGHVGDVANNGAITLTGQGGTLSGFGTQFTGFTTLDVAPGAFWTVESTLAALDDGQTIAGFALGDTIVLDGFAATTETTVAGTGIELGDGGSTYTIGLAGNYGGHGFDVTTDGTNTTITLDPLISTISTAVGNSVTLGNGTYAPTLTVTDTGSVTPGTRGATAIFVTLATATLLNQGQITGAAQAYHANGMGGAGVSLSAGALNNDGRITGGTGYDETGDLGGTGVTLSGGSLTNDGTISGGFTGVGQTSGDGGAGIQMYGGSLTNEATGAIVGGNGEAGASVAGTGVSLSAGTLNNDGTIAGGTGYNCIGGGGVSLSGGTLTNRGTITGGRSVDGGTCGTGVSLSAGMLTNDGIITGGRAISNVGGGTGVSFSGGILANDGTIVGGATSIYYIGGTGLSLSGGAVVNGGAIIGGVGGSSRVAGRTGTGGAGAQVSGGASLTNQGTITGGVGGNGPSGGNGGAGVYLDGGTLVNAGTIGGGAGGSNGQAGFAVQFGSQAGTLIIDPGAVFNGQVAANSAVDDVLVLAGATAATLTGLGTQFTGFDTLTEESGADWTLTGANSFGGTATLNGTLGVAGSLDLTGSMEVVNQIYLGGSLTVATGASLFGSIYDAVYASGAGATLLIQQGGSLQNGVVLTEGAVAVNDGLVQSWNGASPFDGGGTGFSVRSGATLTNDGTIIGGAGTGTSHKGAGGAGVYVSSGVATNAGLIEGGSGNGIAPNGAGLFLQGGTFTNTATGSISGASSMAASDPGVALYGGTLINAGRIAAGPGAGSDAVQFGSAAGTLVIDPHAVFAGNVVAHYGDADALMLAAGAGTGTLAGLGWAFTGFDTLTEVAGADWWLKGANSFAGTATLDGQTRVTDRLQDSGSITLSGSLELSGVLAGTGSLTIQSGGTLTGRGTVVPGIADGGLVEAAGGRLTLEGAVTGTGQLVAAAGAMLELSGGGTLSQAVSGAGEVILHDAAFSLAGGDIGAATLVVGMRSSLSGYGTIGSAVASSGTLIAAGGTLELTGTFGDFGALSAAAGATLMLSDGGVLGAAISGSGTLDLSAGGFAIGAGLATIDLIAIGAGAALEGDATLAGSLADDGMLTAAGGTLTVEGAVSGTGTLGAVAGAVLSLSGGGTLGGSIRGAGTLDLGGTAAFTLTAATPLAIAEIGLAAGATLSGSGTLAGSVSNAGLIDAAGGTLVLDGGYSGSGKLAAAAGAVLQLDAGATLSGTVSGGGTLALLQGRPFTLAGADITVAALQAGPAAVLSGTGTIASTVTNDGVIEATGGRLTLLGGIGGTGMLEAAAGSVLELAGGGALSMPVSGGGELILHDAAFTLAGGDIGIAEVLTGPRASLSGYGTIAGAITNLGTLAASGGTLKLTGALTGRGVLEAKAGAALLLSGGGNLFADITGAGTLALAAGATTLLAQDSISIATVQVKGGATLGGAGMLAGTVIDNGTLTAAGGTLTVGGALSGSGLASISAHSALCFLGSVAATDKVDFAATTGRLDLGDPAGFAGFIEGFGAGRLIDLEGTVADGWHYANSTLTLLDGNITVATLHFGGGFGAPPAFTLHTDNAGGTLIGFG